MNTIIIQNLHKKFKDHKVLQGVSLQAAQGEVISLLGCSGSGKSTLLRCVNLLETPDIGAIQVGTELMEFGANAKPLSPAKKTNIRSKLGMVFQQFNLWAHLTVLENLITAPIHVLKQSKTEAIAQAHHLLNKVGLSNKQNEYPARLSGGQQQRVAIARALMMKPEAMLFDEPTSALDPEMRGEVLQVIKQLALEGMTMIISSHEMRFARDVASRIVFLDEGKILEEGSANEIFTNPKTKRLQRFIESVRYS